MEAATVASIHPSVCSSVRPSVRSSVRSSVCSFVRSFVRPSVRPSVRSCYRGGSYRGGSYCGSLGCYRGGCCCGAATEARGDCYPSILLTVETDHSAGTSCRLILRRLILRRPLLCCPRAWRTLPAAVKGLGLPENAVLGAFCFSVTWAVEDPHA